MKSISHAESATFAKDFSDQKNNPYSPWRPLRATARPGNAGREPSVPQSPTTNLPLRPLRPWRESIHKPHATSAKAATYSSKLHLNFLTFLHSHVRTPFRPLRPWREQSAFSLTEVVIAMGVAAVAFTSIIALFPLGLNMSKESYEATQAALIAQSIMADLSDQTSSTQGKVIQKTGSNNMDSNNYVVIPMTGTTSLADRDIYLAYDQNIRTDSSNNPIMLRPFAITNTPNTWFRDGTNNGLLLVKVSLKHSFRMSPTGTANPQRVDITIESPASAKATNRVQYVFSGVIPQA